MAKQPTKSYFSNPISNQIVYKKDIEEQPKEQEDQEDSKALRNISWEYLIFTFKYVDGSKIPTLGRCFYKWKPIKRGTPLYKHWMDFRKLKSKLFRKYFPKIYDEFIKKNPSSKPIDKEKEEVSDEFYDYFFEKFDFILTVEFIKYQKYLISKLPNKRVNSDLYKEITNSLTKCEKNGSLQDLDQDLEQIAEDLKKIAQLRFEDQLSDNQFVNNSDDGSKLDEYLKKVNDDSLKEKKFKKFEEDLLQHFEQTGENLRKIEEQWQIKDEKKVLMERLGICSVISKNIPHSSSSSMKGFTKL